MNGWWWLLIAVWVVGCLWAWACCRVAAKADQDWDEIVAKLRAEEETKGLDP